VDAVSRAKSLCDRGKELHNARRRLVGLLPGGVFEFFLALVVFNLGVAYSELSLWDSAAKAYQEALHNFQRSVSEYPEASDFGIAQSLCRLGKTLHRLQQSE
jgi:tetratricopeptide (TPR) repeat protein